MIIWTIKRIPYGNIGYLLEFSMAFSSCYGSPKWERQLTIAVLLKAYCKEVELRYQWDETLSKVAYAYFDTIQRAPDKHLLKDIEGRRKPLKIASIGQSVAVEENNKRS